MPAHPETARILEAQRHRPPPPRGNHCPRCFSWAPGTVCQCGHARRPDGKLAEPCPNGPAGIPNACGCAAKFGVELPPMTMAQAADAIERAWRSLQAATSRHVGALKFSSDALHRQENEEAYIAAVTHMGDVIDAVRRDAGRV